jgi:nitrite reductase (NADH) small subunit
MNAAEKSFQRVGSLDTLRGSGPFAATVAGQRIAVFNIDGTVIATQGRCPHAKGPIHEAQILGDTLTCPWHGYCFSLSTGACEDDPALTLVRYEVRLEGDNIMVLL